MSDHPWEHVKIDFCGPFPSGHYLLVIIDCYSRFPEVETLKLTSCMQVIPKLDSIFARHGVPTKLTSDNGPPFQSDEFKRYMLHLGIKHHHSIPLWPQGNSEVEAFNKPLEKAIRAAHVENRPWQQEVYKFLLSYRSTPHSTTKVLLRLGVRQRETRIRLLLSIDSKNRLTYVLQNARSSAHVN